MEKGKHNLSIVVLVINILFREGMGQNIMMKESLCASDGFFAENDRIRLRLTFKEREE